MSCIDRYMMYPRASRSDYACEGVTLCHVEEVTKSSGSEADI